MFPKKWLPCSRRHHRKAGRTKGGEVMDKRSKQEKVMDVFSVMEEDIKKAKREIMALLDDDAKAPEEEFAKEYMDKG